MTAAATPAASGEESGQKKPPGGGFRLLIVIAAAAALLFVLAVVIAIALYQRHSKSCADSSSSLSNGTKTADTAFMVTVCTDPELDTQTYDTVPEDFQTHLDFAEDGADPGSLVHDFL
jgi:hypothetical protein